MNAKHIMLAGVAVFSLTAAGNDRIIRQSDSETKNAVTTSSSTITTSTTTVTTVSEVVRQEKKWAPLRVAVLDFNTADTIGQKRFLSGKNHKIEIPPQCTLNNADRKSVDNVVQGYIRMIDARDQSATNSANRSAQEQDNARSYKHARELYETAVKGESRPMVIGAEYLAAYLGRHPEVFACIDSGLMSAAMETLASEPDFPTDFLRKLAKKTGATHLIYGTVSDLRGGEKSFSGYGVNTKTMTYQLDMVIKVVDLNRQHTVFSNVYTGTVRERHNGTGGVFDHNLYQTLMNNALEQAAEELLNVSRPGAENLISAPVEK